MANAFSRFLETFLFSLCKLNQIQFSAPWRTERGGC